jgi:hypothetical protein
MKTRNAEDIRDNLASAERRLSGLKRYGNSEMDSFDLMKGWTAERAIPVVEAHNARYERELEAATRFGEQLVLAF